MTQEWGFTDSDRKKHRSQIAQAKETGDCSKHSGHGPQEGGYSAALTSRGKIQVLSVTG